MSLFRVPCYLYSQAATDNDQYCPQRLTSSSTSSECFDEMAHSPETRIRPRVGVLLVHQRYSRFLPHQICLRSRNVCQTEMPAQIRASGHHSGHTLRNLLVKDPPCLPVPLEDGRYEESPGCEPNQHVEEYYVSRIMDSNDQNS